MNFKVKDKLKCFKNGGYGCFLEGKIYTVSSAVEAKNGKVLYRFEGTEGVWTEEFFTQYLAKAVIVSGHPLTKIFK
jgi:hypothetical protein